VAGIALLAIAATDARMGEHHDPRPGAVHAGLPRALLGHRLAVLVLGRVLAEVPDVALRVLGVVVERVLDEPAALGDPIVHDAREDAGGDALGAVRDAHDVVLSARAVLPPRPGLHRPVRVVDVRPGGEGQEGCGGDGEHARDRTGDG
jgi:hypothetical protein